MDVLETFMLIIEISLSSTSDKYQTLQLNYYWFTLEEALNFEQSLTKKISAILLLN